MAIDYKKEWDKLHATCKGVFISCDEYGRPDSMARLSSRNVANAYNKTGTVISMQTLMNNQIRDTINKRELLMEEYMKEIIVTDISGGDKQYYHVKIINAREPRGPIGTMHILKADFDAWLKDRKEVK